MKFELYLPRQIDIDEDDEKPLIYFVDDNNQYNVVSINMVHFFIKESLESNDAKLAIISWLKYTIKQLKKL